MPWKHWLVWLPAFCVVLIALGLQAPQVVLLVAALNLQLLDLRAVIGPQPGAHRPAVSALWRAHHSGSLCVIDHAPAGKMRQ